MDLPRAIAKVEEFCGQLAKSYTIYSNTPGQFNYLDHPDWRGTEEQINRLRPVVAALANGAGYDVLADRIAGSSHGMGWSYYDVQRASQELLGLFESQGELAEILDPSGPQLPAASLHPWVWEEAAPRWDGGFYRDAVQAAATRVFDVEMPKKLGVQPSRNPADLFAAFAPDKSGVTVLRFEDVDRGSPTWESLHRGTMLLGQACVASIRNPRTHRLVSDEQVALEELATLSLLARRIDDSIAVFAD